MSDFAFKKWCLLTPAFVCMMVCHPMLVCNAAEPQVPIKISKETTYFTEPVDQAGRLDFQTALDRHLKAGVTPENNAAVMLQCVAASFDDKDDESELNYRNLIFKGMGVEPMPLDAPVYEEREVASDAQARFPGYDSIFDRIIDKPWNRKECPEGVQWIAANSKQIQCISEAVKRPQYYVPLIPYFDDGSLESKIPLAYNNLNDVSCYRSYTYWILARAMMHLGEQEYQAASHDLILLHRYAITVASGPELMDELSGSAIDSRTIRGEVELLKCAGVPISLLKKHQELLAKLPSTNNSSGTLNLTERIRVLQAIDHMAYSPEDTKRLTSFIKFDVEEDQIQAVVNAVQIREIDWNEVCRQINKNYDLLVTTLKAEPTHERQAKIAEVLESFKQQPRSHEQLENLTRSLLECNPITPAEATTWISAKLTNGTLSIYSNVGRAETVAFTKRRLMHVALALKCYQLRHQQLPSSLDDLAPEFLDSIPEDPITGNSFIYRPQESEFILYSIGHNGIDEGGRSRWDDPKADDIVVSTLKD